MKAILVLVLIFIKIYIPIVNFTLMIICIALVLLFRSSEALASAYGLAVCFDLFITDIFFVIMMIVCLRIPILVRIPLALIFAIIYMPISGAFLAANITKFIKGGWIPIVIGFVATILMLVWKFGSTAVRKAMKKQTNCMTYEEFHRTILPNLNIVKNSAGVFLVPNKVLIPAYMSYWTDLMKVMPETIIFLTVKCFKVPVVPAEKRLTVESVGPHMYRVILRYGFYESKLNVQDLLIDTYLVSEITPAKTENGTAGHAVISSNTNTAISSSAITSIIVKKFKLLVTTATYEDDDEYKETSIPIIYYLPRDRLRVNRKYWFFKRWPASFFTLLHRNSRNDLTGILDLPARQIIEVGTQVQL